MTLIKALGLADARLIALIGAGGKTSLMFALAKEFADTGDTVLLTTTTRLAADEAAGPWPEIIATDPAEIVAAAPPTAGAVLVHAGIDAVSDKVIDLDAETVDRVTASRVFDRILIEVDGAARRPLKVPAAHEPVIPRAADTVIAVAGLSGVGRPLSGETVFRTEAWSGLTGLAAGDAVTATSVTDAATHAQGFAKGAPATAVRTLFLNQADTPDRIATGRAIARRLAERGTTVFARVVIARLTPAPEIADVIVLDPEDAVPR